MNQRFIYVVGPPGCGNHEIADALARVLRWQNPAWEHVDMDRYIEEHHGAIRTIIEKHGSDKLRHLDLEVLLHLRASPHRVFSTHHRCVLDKQAYVMMKAHGTVVWLDLKPEEVIRRAEVKNESDRLRLDDCFRLCEARKVSADVTVNGGLPHGGVRRLDETVEEIMERLALEKERLLEAAAS